MREIKFAWVCRNKYFNEVSRVELTDTMLIDGSRPSWITSPNCEVLAKILPTGRYDNKNGKEIWEGDIVRFDVRRGRTEGEPPRFNQKGKVAINSICLSYGAWDAAYCEKVEVIGNIWENPELLEHTP